MCLPAGILPWMIVLTNGNSQNSLLLIPEQWRNMPGAERFNLNRLAVFAAVAESDGFTAAAERLGVAKAKVSLEIRRLEVALGVNLFSRTTRRVVLTDGGRQLYESGVPLLHELNEALARVGADRSIVAGRLKISTSVNHATNFLARVVAEFGRKHPELHIHLSATDRVVDLVAEGVDVAIRSGWLRDSSLRALRLGDIEQCVVAAPEYLRRHGTPQRPAELAQHEWIALSLLPTPLTWKFRSKRGRISTVRVKSRLMSDSPDALHALVAGGAGITVLTELQVAEDLRRGRLQRLLTDWTLPGGGIFAVYPPGRHVAPNVRAFVDFYRAKLAPA
jgi:DNA-binding transcriptional LysR family regulator